MEEILQLYGTKRMEKGKKLQGCEQGEIILCPVKYIQIKYTVSINRCARNYDQGRNQAEFHVCQQERWLNMLIYHTNDVKSANKSIMVLYFMTGWLS